MDEGGSLDSCLHTSDHPGSTNPVGRKGINEMQSRLTAVKHTQDSVYRRAILDFSSAGRLARQVHMWKNLKLVDKVQDNLNIAIWETDLLACLNDYLEQVEIEAMRLEFRQVQLKEENCWLQERQRILKERLQRAQSELKAVEAERDVQKITYRLRKDRQENRVSNYHMLNFDLGEGDCLTELLSPKARGVYHLTLRYLTEGRVDVAAALCSQSLQDQNKCSGFNRLDCAVFNFLLGIIFHQKMRMSEAIQRAQNALDIIDTCVDRPHQSTGLILSLLAECLVEVGDYTEAEDHLRRAIAIRRESAGDDHREVIRLKVDLCKVLLQLGNSNEVILLCHELLSRMTPLYSAKDSMLIRAKLLFIRAQLNLKQDELAYTQLATLLRECFPRANGQTMMDLLNQSDNAVQESLFCMYENLDDSLEIEALELLKDVYEAQGKAEAVTQLSIFLNKFH